MKLVSVIIPYYKKKNYLEKAINSVLKQSYKNIELIIIFDDSDLKYFKILKKKFKKINKVKIIKNKKNLGAGFSRNIGIKLSKGYYIAFLDSDDIWNKNKLEVQIDFMEKNNINISHTSYKIINEKNMIIGRRKAVEKLTYKELIKSCDIGLSTVVLKKKIISKNNLFPKLTTKEDYVLWLNLSKKKLDIYGIDKDLVFWRKIKNSLSTSILQKIKDGFLVYNKYMGYNSLISILFLVRLSVNYLIKSNSKHA
tara:strand:- start:1366 stop:2124 length:759 start_codon:yes stop_codon:yes gene_type:complete